VVHLKRSRAARELDGDATGVRRDQGLEGPAALADVAGDKQFKLELGSHPAKIGEGAVHQATAFADCERRRRVASAATPVHIVFMAAFHLILISRV
jgi:hypothetical protein